MFFKLQTPRLEISPFQLEHASFLLSLNSDREVLKHTGDSPFKDLEAAKSFLAQYDQYDKYGLGRWVVKLRKTNEYIGWCGLKMNDNKDIDLGFRFYRASWGKGYATEASNQLLDFGFRKKNIERIIARTSIHNIAAQKVLEKIGMFKQHIFNYEGIGDCYYYCISKKQFLQHEKMS